MQKLKKYLFYFTIICIFILGIVLRTKLYLESGIFEDDECRLAYSMMTDSYLDMFKPLGPWSSSPIFMFVSKIIAEHMDFNEYALEFLPYLFSIVSIFIFYIVSKQFFQRKFTFILANYLFAVNTIIIYFSATFKQYSLDLMICLLCLYYFSKIDLTKLPYKQTFIMSAIFAFLPLCSLPALFYIAAFLFVNWLKNLKNIDIYKKLAILIVPISIAMLIFYIFNLSPTKTFQMAYYGEMWSEFYNKNLLRVLYENFVYFFSPNKQVFIMLFLTLCSYILFCFDRTTRRIIDANVLLIFLFVVLASEINVYPYFARAALHIAPILIFLILKPLDILSAKKIPFYFIGIFTLICFLGYFSPSFLRGAYNLSDKYILPIN